MQAPFLVFVLAWTLLWNILEKFGGVELKKAGCDGGERTGKQVGPNG
jgi:hypothetical protein